MKHTVIKLGGSVLRGPRDAEAILGLLEGYAGPLLVVVSALKGVTDRLAAAESSPAGGAGLLSRLREEYLDFALAFGAPAAAEAAAARQIERLLAGLGRLLDPAEPSSARLDRRARVLATGERLSAVCLSLALASLGRPAPVIEPGRLGLAALPCEEDPEDARAELSSSAPRIRAAVSGLDALVVPGFYGVGPDGLHRLFGRGGSDYSAAVIAACLGASSCDLIKDVPGVFTADPSLVAGARPVLELSYAEASALARGGANILHQRCVEPLREAGVPLRILSGSSAGGETRVGREDSIRPGPGPRAVALARGPSGSAAITVAGAGASKSAALVLRALESRGLPVRAFYPGPEARSFRLLVEGGRGGEALNVAHDALFRPVLAPAGGIA
jgi:bifunctional aspartokinase / homoserine dehydrogenase 1